MRALTLVTFLHLFAQEASHDVNVKCAEFHGNPSLDNAFPSSLVDLKVKLLQVEDGYRLNISWAINIDGSTDYVNGTWIDIDGEEPIQCEYHPPLHQANLTGLKQIWFHQVEKVYCGNLLIQAANLPLPLVPPVGKDWKRAKITVPCTNPRVTQTTTQTPAFDSTTSRNFAPDSMTQQDDASFSSTAVVIFVGLASLMILGLCCIIYKTFKENLSRSLGFKPSYVSPIVPIPVLMVYPAENTVFQQGVVALAEFLQWHGGCNIAVDMWQQGKIAKLGPMRWLAEQVKASDVVLIVRPQTKNASLQSGKATVSSIPAAAHDLYPLIINMVGSHAKSKNDLAKFWVVQLGEQQDRGLCNLEPEFRACKLFCLMKDLLKMCRSLQMHRKESQRTSHLKFGLRVEKNALKLRESVENIDKRQLGTFGDSGTLKSVISGL